MRKRATYTGVIRGQNLELEGVTGVEVIGDRVKATRCTNVRIVGDNAVARKCKNVTVIGQHPTLIECTGVVLTTSSESAQLKDVPVGAPAKRRSTEAERLSFLLSASRKKRKASRE